MSPLAEEIRSRGHWQVIIRPAMFSPKRIPDIAALYPIIEKSRVQLRGWDCPHIGGNPEIRDVDWVGLETNWEHHLEMWRLYRSGQFFHLSALWDDWRDRSGLWPPDKTWASGQQIGVGDVLFHLTEILEFAARFSMTDAGDEAMHIDVHLKKLRGRVLVTDTPRRAPIWAAPATIDEFPFTVDLTRTDLVSNPRELALAWSMELFKRFGWDSTMDLLRGWQSELGRQ